MTRAPRQSEMSLHLQVARYLRAAWPQDLLWYHCPNGELRHAAVAGKLRAMGVLAGVPDFTLHLPRGQVGYIELKAAGGKLNDAQIAFRASCLANGQAHTVAHSLDEVEATVIRWLGAFGLRPRAHLLARSAA